MRKAWHVASLIIVVLLGVTSAVCAKGILQALMVRQVDGWLSSQPTIYTSQLTEEQKDALAYELRGRASQDGFVVVGQRRESLQSGASLYTFSVASPSAEEDAPIDPLVLLGTTVIDEGVVDAVSAGGPDAYAGYGNDVFERESSLPSVRSGLYFRVDKISDGGSLGDSCAFFGLSDAGFQNLVDGLSSAMGVDSGTLTMRMSGSSSEIGLLYLFCAGAFVLLALVLCLLMVTRSLLELKTLGVHLMLGWSKTDFASELLAPLALQMLVVMPIGLLGALATLDGFSINAAFAGFALASVLPAVAVVLLAAVVAVLPLVSVKPVEAIHGRYSQRGFYVLTAAVYLVCLIAVFAGCLYIDQPITLYANLARTRSAWSEYEGWYVVRDYTLGDNRFSGNPMNFAKDMYDWYAEHEHDDGVYLVKASRYEAVSIQAYTGADSTLEPFWYLAASPSYLEEIGLDVPADLIEKAERGVCVCLLPESLSASEAEEMKEYFVASRRVYDSDIVTAFMENPEYEFATYDASEELFTWSTDSELPTTSSGFVVAILTAENMVPFESESLVATGLENSYVMLDERAASTLLDDDKADLGGSISVRFAEVGNYIDGLQKSIGELMALFSVVLVILVVTAAVMVACLIDVVNRVSAREISVKYVLGFGTWELYRREILFVSVTALVGVAVSALLRSNAGMIVGLAILIMSNIVIAVASGRRSAAVVLETVSKE